MTCEVSTLLLSSFLLQGSSLLYNTFVHPKLLENETKIDNMIEQTKEHCWTQTATARQQGLAYTQKFLTTAFVRAQTLVLEGLVSRRAVKPKSPTRSPRRRSPSALRSKPQQTPGLFENILTASSPKGSPTPKKSLKSPGSKRRFVVDEEHERSMTEEIEIEEYEEYEYEESASEDGDVVIEEIEEDAEGNETEEIEEIIEEIEEEGSEDEEEAEEGSEDEDEDEDEEVTFDSEAEQTPHQTPQPSPIPTRGVATTRAAVPQTRTASSPSIRASPAQSPASPSASQKRENYQSPKIFVSRNINFQPRGKPTPTQRRVLGQISDNGSN